MFRTHTAREMRLNQRIHHFQIQLDTREVTNLERMCKLKTKLDHFIDTRAVQYDALSEHVTMIEQSLKDFVVPLVDKYAALSDCVHDPKSVAQNTLEINRLKSECACTRQMLDSQSFKIRRLRANMPTAPIVHANIISSFATGTHVEEHIHTIQHGYTDDSVPMLPSTTRVVDNPAFPTPMPLPFNAHPSEVPPTSSLEMEYRNTIDRARPSSSEQPRFHRYFDGTRIQYINLSDDNSTESSTSNSINSVRSLHLHDSDHESNSSDNEDAFADPPGIHAPLGY